MNEVELLKQLREQGNELDDVAERLEQVFWRPAPVLMRSRIEQAGATGRAIVSNMVAQDMIVDIPKAMDNLEKLHYEGVIAAYHRNNV